MTAYTYALSNTNINYFPKYLESSSSKPVKDESSLGDGTGGLQ
jgi:hypothetical protein